ncbi:MAG: 4Fe-4S binding protein [Planctomycetes bacterium]|nr:4Fe-4S binding protein [Planctomycetota bacterium]MCH8966780.1 4Fe-4S binding protein [Planctomycetota bacterium]
MGDLAIRFGDKGIPEISPEGCVGCGVCSYLCPGGALAVTPRADSVSA